MKQWQGIVVGNGARESKKSGKKHNTVADPTPDNQRKMAAKMRMEAKKQTKINLVPALWPLVILLGPTAIIPQTPRFPLALNKVHDTTDAAAPSGSLRR